MDIYNYTYYCMNKRMYVSLGYCENCYEYHYHDGFETWYFCLSNNLVNNRLGENVNF